MTNTDKVTVVLSTYNHPVWLRKVLWGYEKQHHANIEIIVADDGSRDETRSMINRVREESGMDIKHVWHPDEGFAKCKILNRAIEAASTDYMIFSDGDCVPRGDFVSHHVASRVAGRFLSGGYYKLPMPLSGAISEQQIKSGEAFELKFLWRGGVRPSLKDLRVVARGRGASVLNAITTTKPTWNGNNSSGWTDDLKRAGGFDERMRYGGQDREFGQRLENAGVTGIHVRYQTLLLHLDHARGYANPEDLANNKKIRAETLRSGIQTTDFGLNAA